VNAGLVAVLPFVLVPALLASGRAGALAAGLFGLIATVVAVLLIQPGDAVGSLLAR